MIVSSLLILVTAAVLLVTGMITGNNHLLYSSIAASSAAGIALYVGASARARRRPSVYVRPPAVDDTQELKRVRLDDTPTTEMPLLEGKAFEPTDYVVDRDPELRFEDVPPRQTRGSTAGNSARDAAAARAAAADAQNEPTEQRMSTIEASALMRLDTHVAVVDGRPRFHHTACVHLVGREHEPLPVAEALELGFSPCGMCEPASRLLMVPLARS
ncbi:hypothetical protein [Glycomyces buryatensis]|uniref:Uncharacterized protein n=1 Tax=Glycomyces buryatensis TaxID=2570927 RepID=A0A4S8Q5F5_9ACTN|nr:hypothetical protein [Glycomyces buryatensis]THV39527.1 hypothetical protein FAB82_18165 [Glycomyces buryatensis]